MNNEQDSADAAAVEGKYKPQIDGLNRRNTLLQQERDDLKEQVDRLRQDLEKASGANAADAQALAIEAERLANAREAIKMLSEGELPLSALDLVVGADFSETKTRVERLAAILKDQDRAIRNTLLGSGPRPKSGDRGGGDPVADFARKYPKLTREELVAVTKDNPRLWRAFVEREARRGR